jgi:hypothetical protein
MSDRRSHAERQAAQRAADLKAIERELPDAADRQRKLTERQQQIARHMQRPKLAAGITVGMLMAGKA